MGITYQRALTSIRCGFPGEDIDKLTTRSRSISEVNFKRSKFRAPLSVSEAQFGQKIALGKCDHYLRDTHYGYISVRGLHPNPRQPNSCAYTHENATRQVETEFPLIYTVSAPHCSTYAF